MNALHELHFPSSRISATHILQRSVWNALNQFPCEVVTVKSASMVLTLYKHIHMEVGRLISCHYQPIHYLFYGLCKESDETVPESCQCVRIILRYQMYASSFYRAPRSRPFPAAGGWRKNLWAVSILCPSIFNFLKRSASDIRYKTFNSRWLLQADVERQVRRRQRNSL